MLLHVILWRFNYMNGNIKILKIWKMMQLQNSFFFFLGAISLCTRLWVIIHHQTFYLNLFIIIRYKRMVPMPWLMKKIVFSSFRIVQGAKLQSLPSSFLWKEQVIQILPSLFSSLFFSNEFSKQFPSCRLVWCWSWPLWAPDCTSFRPCFTRKGCCCTVRLPSLQFCGDRGWVELEFLHPIYYGPS